MRSKWIKVLAAAVVIAMALPAAGSAAPLEPDKECSLKVEAIKPTEENGQMHILCTICIKWRTW